MRKLVILLGIVVFVSLLVPCCDFSGSKNQEKLESEALSALQGSWKVVQHPSGWIAVRYVFRNSYVDFYWNRGSGAYQAGTYHIQKLEVISDGTVRLTLTMMAVMSDNTTRIGEAANVSYSVKGDTMRYTYCDSSWKPLADAMETLQRE